MWTNKSREQLKKFLWISTAVQNGRPWTGKSDPFGSIDGPTAVLIGPAKLSPSGMIGTLWNGTATRHPGGGFRTCWTCIIEPIPSIGGRQSKGEEGCSLRDSILSRPGKTGAVLCVTLSLKTLSSENYKFRLVYSTQNYPTREINNDFILFQMQLPRILNIFFHKIFKKKSAQIYKYAKFFNIMVGTFY